MQRRKFLGVVGAAAAWPLGARAQQSKMPVIGFLSVAPGEGARMTAFHQALKEAGFVEGQNVAVEYRWAEGKVDRLPTLAADLVRRQVSVIVAITFPGALAAKAATTATPIVFTTGVDPVQGGLVDSFNRPQGNLTGVNQFTTALQAKRLELLRELVTKTDVIAMLVNPANPSARIEIADIQIAARAVGQQVQILNVSNERDIDTVFAMLARQRTDALLIGAGPLFTSQRDQIVALAARYAIPTNYSFRESVTAGGLVSYGISLSDVYRQVGIYTGRILKGERPGDLPVIQPTKFELVINLRTARALGLAVPPTLLARADEVIE